MPSFSLESYMSQRKADFYRMRLFAQRFDLDLGVGEKKEELA